MELKQTIKRVLREESDKDYTSFIKSILTNLFVADHKDEICKVDVVHPREEMNAFRPDYYNVIFYFKGLEFKFLPKSHLKEELMNEAWDLIYNYTGERINMWSQYVKDCGDIIQENKENSIPKMIKILGISDAIKYFGNYYTIEPYLKVIDKVNFIKEKVDEISEGLNSSGISLYELNEEPIFYDEDDNELRQIEYLGKDSVYVDVYNDDGDTHVGDFRVTYEGLSVEIIERLVEILLNN
jgi:hypothetical protein